MYRGRERATATEAGAEVKPIAGRSQACIFTQAQHAANEIVVQERRQPAAGKEVVDLFWWGWWGKGQGRMDGGMRALVALS